MGCLGVYHPNLSFPVVFKRRDKDVSLSTVCGKGLSTVRLAVHQRLHSDRYKWLGVVVMLPIHVGVGGDLWVYI